MRKGQLAGFLFFGPDGAAHLPERASISGNTPFVRPRLSSVRFAFSVVGLLFKFGLSASLFPLEFDLSWLFVLLPDFDDRFAGADERACGLL